MGLSVGPSVGPSVGLSVGPSVGPSVKLSVGPSVSNETGLRPSCAVFEMPHRASGHGRV